MDAYQHSQSPWTKGPTTKGSCWIQRWGCIHEPSVQLVRGGLMILLFLHDCVLLCSKFYGSDVEPTAKMSWGLWELCENSQLKCEDVYLKFLQEQNSTFYYLVTSLIENRLGLRERCPPNYTQTTEYAPELLWHFGRIAHMHLIAGWCRHWHIWSLGFDLWVLRSADCVCLCVHVVGSGARWPSQRSCSAAVHFID